MTAKTTVMIADDQPVVRDGFAAIVRAQPDMEVVGVAADGQQLVDLVRSSGPPDVAVVDIRMPRLDGIAACQEISALTRVLILTTFDLDDYVRDALNAGASGFLLKDVPAERLVDGVRLVAGGAMLLGPNVRRRLVQEVAVSPVRPRVDLTEFGLTEREQVVFGMLARGLSNGEIAHQLVVSTETVKSHVAEVLRKLHLPNRTHVVVFAYENRLV